MKSKRYLVVSRGESFADSAGPALETLGGHQPEPAASLPRAEVVELDRSDARDALRDDKTLAVIPSIPIVLIRPVKDGQQDCPGCQEQVLGDDRDDATWGLEAIGALASNFAGAGVKVAVLDTGIDLQHPAFERLLEEGRIQRRNFTAGAADDVGDHDGHGTHCAATICGGVVDGVRLGVAPELSGLLVGKVLGPGAGGADRIGSALLWATESGADVISMSLGYDFPGWVAKLVEDDDVPVQQATSMALEDYRQIIDGFREITDVLRQRGTLVVAATGNESCRPKYTINVAPPSAADGIVSVGAVARFADGLGVACFSNSRPAVVAPGVRVRSARLGGGLTESNGTSMATPHVAGIAALWHQALSEQNGHVTRDMMMAKLLGKATLDPLRNGSKRWQDVGSGLVQAP